MALIRAYLFAYNVVQIIGWSYIGFLFIKGNAETNFEKLTKSYHYVDVLVKVFQTLALLEVIHSMIGFVKSPWVTTMTQVASRILVVWPVCDYVPEVKEDCLGIPMFVVAWTITEIIRYSFYATNLVGSVPYPIKWMRYSFFIFLYPIGVSGELLTIFKVAGIAGEKGLLTYSLPNVLNISFSYQYFLYAVMLMYIPIFPSLYGYMLSQRKKVLGADSRKKLE